MSERLRIVVTGLVAQHPLLGGMTWHYLQYVAGLARLGHDVWYLEDSGEWPYNLDGGATGSEWVAPTCDVNVAHLADALSRYGLDDRWAYRFPTKDEWYGLHDERRREVLATADLLINVSGSLEDPARYRQVPRMAYIDSDPVFTQLHAANDAGRAGAIAVHDVHFSFGEHVDRLPSSSFSWRPTRQPILLDAWEGGPPAGASFTTVMNWTSYASATREGEQYGQKDVEFLRFLALPQLVGATFEVALPELQHPEWEAGFDAVPAPLASSLHESGPPTVHDVLEATGWRPVDAIARCAGLDQYRSFVFGSRAEWTVAKNGYVRGRPGWFSERSACYLAAGRPVVTQDTGLAGLLPIGTGLLTFETLEEAVAAVEDVEARYTVHASAAREIAAECFDAEDVLGRLVEDALA